jgi:hypothetical protein
MMKPAVTVAMFLVPLLATSASYADTTTTTADTLVVVTPNAPIVVNQGGPQQVQQVEAEIQGPSATPVRPQTANGAPQNEDWNNVSHINGVPVKVGERGDYLYDNGKRTNISANPFGLFFGYYDISVAHALSRNIAANVSVSGSAGDFYQVSATLPIYFRRTFSGPYLEPGLLVRSERSYDCYDCTDTMSDAWLGPQMMFGWQWTFDSGLNVSMAAGVAKHVDHQDEYDDGNEFNGYFRVGYAF